MSKCFRCGAELSVDEIGVYKKLINRGAEKYLCIPCLSKELKISEEEIRRKIEQFKKAGCTLFN